MKNTTRLLGALVALVSACTSYADLISVDPNTWGSDYYNFFCDPLGTGSSSFTPGANASVSVSGDQYWAPDWKGGTGTMTMDFTASSTSDPTLSITNSINNDTGLSWSSFQVIIYMPTNFTISGTFLTAKDGLLNPLVPAWTFSPASPVSSPGPGTYFGANEWSSTITFNNNGTLLPPNGQLFFGYTLTFTGLTHYTVIQDFTPTVVEVPEPGIIGLATFGGLLSLAARRKFSRAA